MKQEQDETVEAEPSQEDIEAQWEQYYATHIPIKKHSYPALVKIFFVIMLCLLVYSFFSVPKNFKTAKIFKQARIDFKSGNLKGAYNNMADVLNAGFYSDKTRVLMAKILLSTEEARSDNDENQFYEKALGLLQGLELDKKTYDEILKLMPPRYFEEEKDAQPQNAPEKGGGK